jgi:DNA (cytosine-5)-methyltransferase 1
VDHPKELTHISLCAGYGGIDLGLRGDLGAVRTVAFSEIEAFPCENLVAKIEAGLLDAAPIWTDLKTFPWSAFRGSVDILSGGFPCQPFSSAGQRRGDDDPRHLWPHIVRGIRELGHPPLVFFENVEGIISSKLTSDEWSDPAGTSVLLHVLRELERLGYDATAGVFSAREVGLPHQRKRVFILGARHDLTHDQREWVSSLLRINAEHRTASPAPRGADQYGWEPPRVTREQVGDTDSERSLRGLDENTPRTEEGWQEPSRSAPAPGAPSRGGVGDTDNEGSQRCGAHAGSAPHEGRHTETGPATSTSAPSRELQRQTEPTLGRDADGFAGRMDYEELCHSVDNRTDELRLLGNGVVPATAERAFRVLWSRVPTPPPRHSEVIRLKSTSVGASSA